MNVAEILPIALAMVAGCSSRPSRAIDRSGLVLIFSALGIFSPLASWV